MPSVRSNLFCLFGLCIRILWLRPLEATSLNLKCHLLWLSAFPFLTVPYDPLVLSTMGKWLSKGGRRGMVPPSSWNSSWQAGEQPPNFQYIFEQSWGRDQASFPFFLRSLDPLCATWFPITDITDAWDAQLRRRLTSLATSAQSHLVHGLRWGSTGHRKPLTSWWPGNREKE